METSGFKSLPFLAQAIIVGFAVAGLLSVLHAIRIQSAFKITHVAVLLVIAAITARTKTKFYAGATISFLTSVVMIAVLSEGLAASLLVAVFGVAVQSSVQCKRLVPYRLIFNVGMISVTVTAAWWTHHALSIIAQSSHAISSAISSEVAATVLASLVYFIGNSLSVALILATVRITSVFDLWTNHFVRCAPSFVSAGVLAFGFTGLLLSDSLPYQLISSWFAR